MKPLENSDLRNIKGGWNKKSFEFGKKVGRVGVFVAGFTPWGKLLRK